MSSHDFITQRDGVSKNNKKRTEASPSLAPVGLAILVMGLSLAAITILYVWFGHLGSAYSSEIMEKQQRRLRAQYGLPPEPVITNETILQTPPSLRDLSSTNRI